MRARMHAWVQFHGIWVSLECLDWENNSATYRHPTNHSRLNASDLAVGTVVLDYSTFTYRERTWADFKIFFLV